jgi:hypothetical protein
MTKQDLEELSKKQVSAGEKACSETLEFLVLACTVPKLKATLNRT